MALALKNPAYEQRRYTYTDYCKWEGPERWELIDGVPFLMAAPSVLHQNVLTSLLLQLGTFLRGKKCKVFPAPFDVRLNAHAFDNTVVQPDILVVCDKSKLNKAGLVGAPDMAIEIISPSSVTHDTVKKHALYLKSGVKEFWIVDPETQTVVTHILSGNTYKRTVYTSLDKVPVYVLKGLVVDLGEVFEELF